MIRLVLTLAEQPEGGYTVTCPGLPELITEGDDVRQAIVHAADALAAVIEGYTDLGRANSFQAAMGGGGGLDPR